MNRRAFMSAIGGGVVGVFGLGTLSGNGRNPEKGRKISSVKWFDEENSVNWTREVFRCEKIDAIEWVTRTSCCGTHVQHNFYHVPDSNQRSLFWEKNTISNGYKELLVKTPCCDRQKMESLRQEIIADFRAHLTCKGTPKKKKTKRKY